MRIVSAADVTMSAIREGMTAGFSDYPAPMVMDDAQFAFMMRQRGLDAAASRVAVVDSAVQAIWLVSVAGAAAYLISAATRIAARGKGIGSALAAASNAALSARGVKTLCTEVMEENDGAYRLYPRMGMRQARLLDCYALPEAMPEASIDVEDVGWSEVCSAVAACRDWAPTWQNDDAALGRVAEAARVFAVRDEAGLAGYAAMIDRSAVLAQIAVRPDRRRQGLGRALVAQAVGAATRPLRVLNADRADDGFAGFMTQAGAQWIVGQRALVGPI